MNKEAAKIIEQLALDNRVQEMKMSTAFITIKDHKPELPHKVQGRLLNQIKSHIGHISKHYLEQVNNSLREILKYN